MIFVTVGTHEQQFNRLIKEVDRLKGEGFIQDDVFIQTGYSNYVPKFCKWEKVISYEKMNQLIKESDIIITHGGPATFMAVIAKGKNPIIVPRLKKFGEHVNDHQMQFVKITKEIYNLIVIDDISDLHLILHNFKDKHFETYLNNERFNVRFNVEISNLFKGNKINEN
ncbi:ss-1,4-galactosyltransferase [Streptococcus pneumoniae]|uniref:Ss-1,4-galactosyltransferase n=1 Tax=Streptococcus pneumoniae (strain JJA) TaxID=488222 RepID=C1CCC2_STRZJ|nr:glycosyltransferase [Streptococcus pneumoniae]EHE27172.1 glycosyltransferase family 28 C-terminal domain protein [Streptococcus pneumoniae GA41688]EHE81796.1 glycosyltransferase family 28 C-terminal domain protein [Streptococcus pneumoniae GA13338]ACB89604.1 ss-1,4-galactosyltransferase [Streptococcus pneumoniae CGSP14]ACO19942.1 ss-1,4-galactosyltransferase [Streptococcus pneumoniae JJA]EFL68524.1 ss-1,4-galactosyltransferase [Streptococcus pneumoniae SP14-BS292]